MEVSAFLGGGDTVWFDKKSLFTEINKIPQLTCIMFPSDNEALY